MNTFVFEIRDASHPDDDFQGDVTLAGVRVGDERQNLVVGDTLLVPVSDGGLVLTTVVEFPLIRFVERDWRAVSVTGVKAQDVVVGSRAERAPND